MLLLIRTEARREEFAMCLALGASRARLVGGVAIEGGILSLAGAALALPITRWLFAGVRTFQLPGGVALDLLELRLDGHSLAAAAACAIGATVIIAVVAAAFGFSASISDALRWTGGSTARAGTKRTRTLLVTGQVAVAMVLVCGAALFARSVMAALSLNPGFDTTRIVTGSVELRPYQYTPVRAAGFFDDLRDRLSANQTIRSMAFTNFSGGMTPAGRLIINGEPRHFASTVSFTAIDPNYFRTIGVAVNRGRDFSADDRAGSALVAIVSQSFGRVLANGGDPIGVRIAMPYHFRGKPPDTMEVVGVVPDLITSVTTLEPLVMYTPMAQAAPDTSRTLAVRAAGDADAMRREVLGAIRQIDRAVTPAPMLTLDERLAAQMGPQRFGALVMGALGVIAVLLTLVGSYVVAESMAVLRRREMAIRAALGARSVQLGFMVFAQTCRLVGVGLLCGLALAWLGASTIRALLFRIQPLDPTTLASVAVLILLLSLAVSVRPALRVAHVDLSRALRED
jgi:predicted permease